MIYLKKSIYHKWVEYKLTNEKKFYFLLPKTLASAIFSNIANNGTTSIADPKLLDISKNEYVTFPPVASNGGGLNSGSPAFTVPIQNYYYLRGFKYMLLTDEVYFDIFIALFCKLAG